MVPRRRALVDIRSERVDIRFDGSHSRRPSHRALEEAILGPIRESVFLTPHPDSDRIIEWRITGSPESSKPRNSNAVGPKGLEMMPGNRRTDCVHCGGIFHT